MIWRLIKLLVFLVVLAGIGLVGYAYLGPIFVPGDFEPDQGQITEPVTLELK